MYLVMIISTLIISIISFLVHFSLTGEKIKENVSKRAVVLSISIFLAGLLKIYICFESISILTILLGIFIGYLAFNTFTDEKSMFIYSFPHIFQLIIGIYILLKFCNFDISYFIYYFSLYLLMQKFIFSKMYALGDTKLFLITALFLAGRASKFFSNESPLLLFMIHMAISLFIFTIYNICRKNITKTGNLKEGMPFAYSIALGFILIF